MMKRGFKKGDLVRVKETYTGGYFEIGSIAEVEATDFEGYDVVLKQDGRKFQEYAYNREIERYFPYDKSWV